MTGPVEDTWGNQPELKVMPARIISSCRISAVPVSDNFEKKMKYLNLRNLIEF